jgi:antitoxin VapB
MERTKISASGDSQVVEIPHHLRLPGDTVYIHKLGSALVLLPVDAPWEPLFSSRALVTDDFLATREQQPWQERDWPE